jgi:hypothetical protein
LSDALGEALALVPEKRPQTVRGFPARLWGVGAAPAPATAATWTEPKTGMDFVRVPGDSFQMESKASALVRPSKAEALDSSALG